jgi:hypothetical protein
MLSSCSQHALKKDISFEAVSPSDSIETHALPSKIDPYDPLLNKEPLIEAPVVEMEKKSPVFILPRAKALGLAYAGVLQKLFNQKIQIGAIVAEEMGALIAGLYSISISVNQFEWFILNLKEEFFKSSNFYFFSKEPTYSELKSFIDKKLQGKKFKIPVYIQTSQGIQLLTPENTSQLIIESFQGNHNLGTLVAFAQTLKLGANILLQFESTGQSAEHVIYVETHEFDANDYSKKAQLIYKGKIACEAHIDFLKSL